MNLSVKNFWKLVTYYRILKAIWNVCERINIQSTPFFYFKILGYLELQQGEFLPFIFLLILSLKI